MSAGLLLPQGDGVLDATPTQSGIAQKLGGFNSITDALDYAAQGHSGLNFYSARGVLTASVSYSQLRKSALAAAARLIFAGLKVGDHIAIIAQTEPDFPIAFYACQYAGLIPCPVPFTSYIAGKDAYIARVRRMMEACGARMLLGPDAVTDIFSEALSDSNVKILSFSALSALPEVPITPVLARDIAYIQYSSGSTAHPKGIVISQHAIVSNVTAILRYGMRLNPDDRAFSWLPFYHDMGLVGFMLAPMFGQCTVDYLNAAAFVRRPTLWLQLMSQNRTSISYAPTFGYDLAGQRFRPEDQEAIDLSAWRIAGIGGDMIRADVLHRFSERLAVANFNEKAFLPSYGLAEATLAVTFANVGEGLVINSPPAYDAAQQNVEHKQFVCCGRAIPEHLVVIVNEKGLQLPDGSIGHIRLQGPSLMRAYLNNPTLTAATFDAEGFLQTGDLGYLTDGYLTVTGRAKDLIIINGRNIWPEDIEWACEQEAGLTHGDVVAFAVASVAGADEVIVMVQWRGSDVDLREAIIMRLHAAVSRAVGVACLIKLVAPRTIEVTSSGKLRRNAARELYLSGQV